MQAKRPSVGAIVDRVLEGCAPRERAVIQTESEDDGRQPASLIKQQLGGVRSSGRCNMLDKTCVLTEARKAGFGALATVVLNLSNFEFLQLIEAFGESRSTILPESSQTPQSIPTA